ncbi:acyltransferase domain-containing protein [Streptomyces sp. NPDC047061]|uniref:acyltransferase domain-containing protein n=1 Tax=Streptomyces sp. NPDC047061 TaxID=3154605 RepID=UPI0033DED92D
MWRERDAFVYSVFSAVDAAAEEEILGRLVTPVVLSENLPGPEELLNQDPDVLQLAVFGLSVAVHRLLTDRGVQVSALMGHSMGELAALACAGAFTMTDGARLLCHRMAALR